MDAQLQKALDLYPYRKILGKVADIARCTRPDVLWITSILQQYQTNYGWRMIDTLLALVSFLYNSKEVMLTFLSGYEASFQLLTFVDASYANCLDTRPLSWRVCSLLFRVLNPGTV